MTNIPSPTSTRDTLTCLLVTVLALVTAGCVDRIPADTPTTGPETAPISTTPSTNASPRPLALQCDGESESTTFDYADHDPDLEGAPSTGAAIAAFFSQGDGRLRPDWDRLTLRELKPQASSGATAYMADGTGTVTLVIRMERWDLGWLVTGWEACAP